MFLRQPRDRAKVRPNEGLAAGEPDSIQPGQRTEDPFDFCQTKIVRGILLPAITHDATRVAGPGDDVGEVARLVHRTPSIPQDIPQKPAGVHAATVWASRACFTRELKPGARPIDPNPSVAVNPCDGIVGACGKATGDAVFQAKGFPYRLADLSGSEAAAAPFHDGCYVTLRLTSSMYHRFHAPTEARITRVTYLSGDTWNVNPIALKRVERLFCRNERAALHLERPGGQPIALVAVAAILVASIRLHGLDTLLHLRWKGPRDIPCDTVVQRGEELGWFEHGSTLLLFTPPGFTLHPSIVPGTRVRMGQALVQLPNPGPLRHMHEGGRNIPPDR
jgi:phosphatidylserine decarboxylase